jgi:hypothetical protein
MDSPVKPDYDEVLPAAEWQRLMATGAGVRRPYAPARVRIPRFKCAAKPHGVIDRILKSERGKERLTRHE